MDRAAEIDKFPAVALFWGSRDRVIPHAQALATLRVLRGAELTTFADCGHLPHQQKPAEFADAVMSFMDATAVREVHFVPPRRKPVLPWHARAAGALRRAVGSAQQSPAHSF